MAMKLSDNTINVLKNYSTINESIVFEEGNRLRTVAKNKSILAETVIEETIPRRFAIYNLNQFIGAMQMFDRADLEFEEKLVKMKFSGTTINYTCADESLVVKPPEKDINFPDAEVKFVMSSENIERIRKASATLSLPEVVFKGEEGAEFVACVMDVNNTSSSVMEVPLGTNSTVKCSMVYKVEALKLITTDYNVAISSKGVGSFISGSDKYKYFIATEASSTFGS